MRDCGGCMVCCTVTQVPELLKPINKTCEHCTTGCGIYETRPQSCRTFECAWLQGEMSDDMRPDKVNFLVENLPGVPLSIVLVMPNHKDWATEEVTKELQFYPNKGVSIMATNGQGLLAKGHTSIDVYENMSKAAKVLGVV